MGRDLRASSPPPWYGHRFLSPPPPLWRWGGWGGPWTGFWLTFQGPQLPWAGAPARARRRCARCRKPFSILTHATHQSRIPVNVEHRALGGAGWAQCIHRLGVPGRGDSSNERSIKRCKTRMFRPKTVQTGYSGSTRRETP